ncbi:MAG TPA: alpha/beta fold hydrolase, partial [Opitutaceae bacterium]|nr:alpha/beta fold hydrolase [Opitutaceae bacterium]
LDRVVAEDALAALDELAAEAGLDRENVATFGTELGGYLALRLMQQHPERIRAVVALDPVTSLSNWVKASASSSQLLNLHSANRRIFFGEDEKRLKAQSPDANAGRLTKPVMLVALSGYPPEGVDPRKLRSLVRSAGQTPRWIDKTNQRGDPSYRAGLFAEIEEFLVRELDGNRSH